MKLFKFLLLSCLTLNAPFAAAGPQIQHWLTPSGARVFFVENHDLPILDVQVDFAAGAAYDPPGKAGLASMTHKLLDLGAAKMDETQISNRLADLGAQLTGNTGMDSASVSLRTLSADNTRQAALAVFEAVLTRPQFPARVFAREKARTVAGLKDALTRPETIASRAFWSAMYPNHPYGRQAAPETVNALKQDDLATFYRRHYTAARAAITLVGDLARPEAEAIAEKIAANLPASVPTANAPSLPAAPVAPIASEQRIAHPSAQAHVMIGLPAMKRGDPDFFPLVVGNYILGGGGFVSRLMHEVREKRGFAYSVHSYFAPMAQPGPFQIGLQTKKEQADNALRLTRDVLAAFLADGPSEAELLAAKQNLVGSFPLRLDSNRKLLDNVAVIGFYGLPLDYLDRYTENVDKVTAEEIKTAFARHVRPDAMTTIVVGAENGTPDGKNHGN